MSHPTTPSAPPTPARSPRQRLLDTAGRLFARHGIQAVGIDRILAEAGVAKMTLYRHFASKDTLVAAYLDEMDRQFWAWVEAGAAGARTPEAWLLALLDALARHAASPECLGCPFQGAALAFPEAAHPAHERALRNKRALRERLASKAREAGLDEPEALAAQLLLLMDGAWAAAREFGPRDNPATHLGEAGRALIQAHRPPRRSRATRR